MSNDMTYYTKYLKYKYKYLYLKNNLGGSAAEADLEVSQDFLQLIENINNTSLELISMMNKSFNELISEDERESNIKRIETASKATGQQNVKPYIGKALYLSDEDFEVVWNYHKIGHQENKENLDLLFRHYLFSSMFHNFKGFYFSNTLIFPNDKYFLSFYNFLFRNDTSPHLLIQIRKIALIYQQLKIYEEKKLKNYNHLEILLSQINMICVFSVFLMFKIFEIEEFKFFPKGLNKLKNDPKIRDEFYNRETGIYYSSFPDYKSSLSSKLNTLKLVTDGVQLVEKLFINLNSIYEFLEVDSPFETYTS